MKKYFVYILQSKDTGKFYTGQTDNIERRVKQHQSGWTAFSKRNKNVILVFRKEFDTLSEARKFENLIKRQKSHKFIDNLVKKNIIPR